MDAGLNDLFDASYFDVVVLTNHFSALDDAVIDGLKLLVSLMTRITLQSREHCELNS